MQERALRLTVDQYEASAGAVQKEPVKKQLLRRNREQKSSWERHLREWTSPAWLVQIATVWQICFFDLTTSLELDNQNTV